MARGTSLLALVVLGVLSAACGAEAPAPPARAPAKAAPARLPIEAYFPLDDGKVYHYETREGDDAGMLVARVRRREATRGELRLSNATKRFVLTPEGAAYEGGAFVLRLPLELGASWPGEHGGTTRVVGVDSAVEVPAGRYAGCVQTLEDGGRVPGARYATTFCPGVGIVLLEVTDGTHVGRAALRSYGAEVSVQ